MNWDTKDWLGIGIQLLTLATTAYFTFQLVRNDNRRERRVEEERQKRRIERVLAHTQVKGLDPLVETSLKILKRHPDKIAMLYDAYADVCFEQETKVSYAVFVKEMINRGVRTDSAYID